MKDRRRTFRSPNDSLAVVRGSTDIDKDGVYLNAFILAISAWIGLFGVLFGLYCAMEYFVLHR